MDDNTNMAQRYEHEIPEGYEARIEGGKVIIELKESEDERIRKEIITYLSNELHNVKQLTPRTNELEAWIAYLKKRREQKSAEIDEYEIIKNHISESALSPEVNKRLKECGWYVTDEKPAECEKSLLNKFEQAVYDCAWGKVTCKPEGETEEEYAKRWAQHFLSMVRDWADDYIDSQIESAKRKAYDKGKADAEKPVECVEFDNEFKNQVSHLLASVLNKEWEYNKGFVEYAAQQLLGYAKHEIKPAEWSERDKSIINNIIAYEVLNIDDLEWLKSLPERFNLQPKQEWGEKDKEMLARVFELIRYADDHYEFDGKEVSSVDVKAWLLKSLYPQPKQEWSEKDKKILNAIISVLEEIKSQPLKRLEDWDGYIHFLKSLRPHPKQELSEEDEDYLRDVKCAVYDYFDEGYAEELCDWLHPHWKPSEEQMKALKRAVDMMIMQYPGREIVLQSLYNELKKNYNLLNLKN